MHFRSLLLSSFSTSTAVAVFTVLVEVPFTRRNFDRPWAVNRARRNGIFEVLVVVPPGPPRAELPTAPGLAICGCSCG